MNIKNYTSSVPAETSIARIEFKLASIGASHVMKMYGPDRKVTAIIFNMPNGAKSYPVKLPANLDSCFEAMWKHHCQTHSRPREETKNTIREQASRTAWRLVQDWIDVQVSMVVMQQAEALQVFLPYVWDGQQTYFESVKHGGFKALPAPRE